MLEVRDYQSRLVEKALQAIQEGHRNVLLESATGSGKTIMAHLIAQRLYEKHGWRTGWTAMRKHLLLQAEADNKRLLGFPHVTYFSTFDKNPPSGIDVLILDEAQHAASETATTLYQRINPKVHLAVTATPFRTDRASLCYSTTIKDAGIRALIDSGWLSPFHQYTFEEEWTPQNVAEVYLREPERWGKTVMYFLTLEECYRCAQLLRTGGIACEVVHGSSDQEAQIAAFNRDELAVLLNVVVLTEGFDCARLKTVFVRPGSKGPTIQQAGRAFRRHPEKPCAQIVQNHRAHWPFTRIASAEAKFVLHNGLWQCRSSEPEKVKVAQANTLLELSRLDVQMPNYLIRRRLKRRLFHGEGAQA